MLALLRYLYYFPFDYCEIHSERPTASHLQVGYCYKSPFFALEFFESKNIFNLPNFSN